MVLHENNSTYIIQIKGEYIKSDQTKDVSPKFFYKHKLQKSG